MRLEGRPSAANPKTSLMAGYSVARELLNRAGTHRDLGNDHGADGSSSFTDPDAAGFRQPSARATEPAAELRCGCVR